MNDANLGIHRMSCCGWREISSLSYYKGDLKHVVRDLVNNRLIEQSSNGPRLYAGALLFTQAGTRVKYGVKFAKDIQEAGLGEVTLLPKFKNPNTDRVIQTFMWVPDVKAVWNFYVKSRNE